MEILPTNFFPGLRPESHGHGQKKRVATLFLILLISLFSGNTWAQQWYAQRGAQKNFYEIQRSFDTFMQGKDTKTKGLGYKQFKRWEWYWQPRVMPDGSFPEAGKNIAEFQKYRQEIQRTGRVAIQQTSTWQSIAQTSSSGGYDGTGRVNCITFHPTDQNILYAGTPGGGIWKSTNGGTSWTALSDNIAQTGVTSIVIDPSNTSVIYIGTGDGFGNLDVKGIGILKSTDGGTTWQNTGLSWTTSQQRVVSAMAMSPANTSILLAATSAGLYKTTDAGATWTVVRSGRHQDVKYKPGDGNTIYASSHNPANIFRSTDGGTTWTQVTSITGANRINIAVTPANTAVVAAIASKASDSGFEGFYYSTNSGASFTRRSSTPNLLGWNANGSDSGGQGWYDLCVAISPTDANRVLVGGVNTWGSTNGGTNWSLNTHWSGAPGVPTVHADKHFIAFHPQNSALVVQCNDGGIYKSTNGGTNWSDITTGLAITMYYRISTAQTNDNIMIGGTQDNGGRKRSSTGAWSMATGGDGMDVAVDPTNFNMMYSSYPGGNVYRSNDQFVNNDVTISDNISSTLRSGWLSPYTLDPNNPAIIYLGYKDVFRTTNRGDAWTRISVGLSTTDLSEIAVSKSSPGTVIVTNGTALFKTTNDGGAWSTITPTGLNGSRITFIAIHPTQANTIWVTLGGYNAGLKVLKSTDGGATWTNISGTLPNVPINCIVYETGSNDALYIGGDIGVYYRDNAESDWSYYNNGLPNCEIISLDIQYSTRKLRAGTWGRGVWQSDLFNTTPPPVACNAPGGLTASGITSTSATVGWSAVTGATNYTVEYKTTATSTWSVAASATTSTSVALSALTASTSYDWRVKTNCTPEADLTNGTGTISAQYNDSPAGEDISKVVDNSTSTKYLTFHNSGWIQFQPTNPSVVTRYSITSANDAPERDPLTWTFQGSTDGTTWATLDTRTNEDFPSRLQRREFSFANTTSYGYYRLNMTNNSGTVLQVAEWEIFGGNISAYATGQFTTTSGTCASSFDTSTNGSFGGAVGIPFNSNVTGLISPTGDEDYYKFTITNGGTITITLTTLPADYDIRLYNNSQTQVAISENGGTTGETINYTAAAGNYYVRIYGWSGANSATQCYTLRVATGTASVAYREGSETGSDRVNIFPNPASNTLSIEIPSEEKSADVRLYDTRGHETMQRNVGAGQSTLNISSLPRGMYLVKVKMSKTVVTKKVFMQ